MSRHNKLESLVPTKSKVPICKICGQIGAGPVVLAQDGNGYVHAYGCPLSHKGQPCYYQTGLPCEEGFCNGCMICLEYSKKTGG